MSNTIGKKLAIALLATAAGAAAMLPAGDAHAGGDVLAAGVLGGLVGAMIATPAYPVYGGPVVVYQEPVYPYPAPVYVAPPAPVYYAPAYEPQYAPVRRPLAAIPYHDRQWRGDDRHDRHDRRDRHSRRADSGGPRVITYDETVGSVASAGAEPWSREWLRYCSGRFRTFDADTGTYKGYDGQRHFCTVD